MSNLPGGVDAQAVGADEGELRLAGHAGDALLEVAAAALRKAARNDHGAAHPAADAVRERLRNEIGSDRDDGQIDPVGDFPDGPIHRVAVEHAAAGVHRVDLDRVAQVELVIDDVGRVPLVGERHPDHGGGFGFEQGCEVHGSLQTYSLNLITIDGAQPQRRRVVFVFQRTRLCCSCRWV